MDRNRMSFCPDLATGLTTQVISDELAAKVFGDKDFAKLLKARYDQMGELFKDARYDDPRWDLKSPFSDCKNKADRDKKDARLVVPRSRLAHVSQNVNVTRLFGYDNFGHDMPVWVSYNQDSNAKRVMIVSQDPLRGSKDANDEKGNLYLSSPFGIHSSDFEEGGRAHMDDRVRDMLNAFLDADFCVYLTDNMKFYATRVNNRGGNVNIVSLGRRGQNGYKARFSKTIECEIQKFDPQLIITLGVKARGKEWTDSVLSSVQHPKEGMRPKILECVDAEKTSVTRYAMSLVHPSRANQWIEQWQLEPAGAGVEDRYFQRAIRTAINQLQSFN